MNESTPRARRKFSAEFKRAALDRWEAGGKTRKAVAAELGISEWNLRDWRQDVERSPGTMPTVRPKTIAELEVENQRLRQENQSLRNQRDILKKSLGILSEPLMNGSRT